MPSLSRLQTRTARAAGNARATGQLSKTAFKAMTDGRVTKTDIKKAKSLLKKAKTLNRDIKREGATSSQLKLSEREIKIADALVDAVTEQYDSQDNPVRRPRTGGGKGSTRPPRRTIRRPAGK